MRNCHLNSRFETRVVNINFKHSLVYTSPRLSPTNNPMEIFTQRIVPFVPLFRLRECTCTLSATSTLPKARPDCNGIPRSQRRDDSIQCRNTISSLSRDEVHKTLSTSTDWYTLAWNASLLYTLPFRSFRWECISFFDNYHFRTFSRCAPLKRTRWFYSYLANILHKWTYSLRENSRRKFRYVCYN